MPSQIDKVSKRGFRVYETISTAFHEAGHTIYALLVEMRVDHVQVFEHRSLKRIHGCTQYKSLDLDKDSSLFGVLLEREIGLSYAGWLAEKHHFQSISGSNSIPSFIKEGSSDDLSSIRSIIKKYNSYLPAGKKRALYKKKIVDQTMSMLLQHWDAVELVSHALFKQKKLSFIDLQNILGKKTKNKKFWKQKFKLINQLYTS